MCRLMATFWEQQEVFTRQSRYHGPHFRATREITQGRLISPPMFSFIVDNVVRNWLVMTVEDQMIAQDVLGLVVGRCLELVYTYDRMVVLRNKEWI